VDTVAAAGAKEDLVVDLVEGKVASEVDLVAETAVRVDLEVK